MSSDSVAAAANLRARPMRPAPSDKGGDLKLKIGPGPECPHCGCSEFDDWFHEKTLRSGVLLVKLAGRLKCHGCGKFFHVTQYFDGQCHCTACSRRK